MYDLRKVTVSTPPAPASAKPKPVVSAPVFSRVVAGIDFGPASLAAARWAFAHLAHDAHAILSHVATSPDDQQPDNDDEPSSFVRTVKRLTPALNGGLGGFAATLRVPSVRTVVRVGRPSHWLGALAAGAEASLIVLGRRSNANRSRVGEPNVIERVTRRTSASVLVVPEGFHDAPRHIVAAIDRSAVGREVIDTATALSDLYGYPVVVLHVVPPPTGAYGRIVANERRARVAIGRDGRNGAPSDASTPRVPAWLKMVARHDRTAEQHQTRVATGDPAREIMAAARALGAAMVVIGKRGEDASPIGSVGSVARELLAAAPIPVLAVDAVGAMLAAG